MTHYFGVHVACDIRDVLQLLQMAWFITGDHLYASSFPMICPRNIRTSVNSSASEEAYSIPYGAKF